jgi:hypothetical protein
MERTAPTDQPTRGVQRRVDDEGRPVLTGLLALVAVAVAVGLILGLVAVVGTRVLGLDGGAGSAGAAAERSMYLPRPEKTQQPSGPLITLAPGETQSPAGNDQQSDRKPPKKEKPARSRISLSAGQTSVSPMEQIDLTGVYPGGEGAILQVQRFTNGAWQDFPVTASVSNQTFSTYVQTSQAGLNRFRVVDTDTHLESNEVNVTIH